MNPLPAVSPARVIDSRSPQGEAGRDPRINTRPMALATDRNVVDEPQPATTQRVGRVAAAVAARLGRRPGTIHQYIHSTTTLRPSDIVAEIADVSLELREAETFEKVSARSGRRRTSPKSARSPGGSGSGNWTSSSSAWRPCAPPSSAGSTGAKGA